jgi:hypothetical protein
MELVPVHDEGPPHPLDQLFGGLSCGPPGSGFEQQGELVTAQVTRRTGGVRERANPLGHFLQRQIAAAKSQKVIDPAEPVEPCHANDKFFPGTGRDPLIQNTLELSAAQQVGLGSEYCDTVTLVAAGSTWIRHSIATNRYSVLSCITWFFLFENGVLPV